jgi:acyl-coenzyme A synthetase/AMP-(fatty) acid ligase/acyl carrier protein
MGGALLNGAALVEVPKEHLLDADRLRSVLRERSITTLLLTTALFNRLVNEDPSIFASLDDLLVGGEAVDPRRVAQVLATAPPRRLLHVYGPAETTTLSTWHIVQNVDPDDETVPIGTALDGYDLHVLDEEMQPVSEHGVGELYIGGEGVARGYVNSPAETAACFVPDPHPATPGRRLYRTGDLVRPLPSGVLSFVGRADSQVKVSGFRIELSEIEGAIQRQSDVAAAAVLVDERDNVRTLVACVQPRMGAELDGRALRTALGRVLPEFMVPRRIVLLRELPLSTNGKIDRAALRGRISEPAGEADRLDLFETFAAICRSVLGTGKIYREDSFIDLGGHSLAAMRIIGRAKKQFDVHLKVSSLFEPTTTIGDIADFIAEHGRVLMGRDGGAGVHRC